MVHYMGCASFEILVLVIEFKCINFEELINHFGVLIVAGLWKIEVLLDDRYSFFSAAALALKCMTLYWEMKRQIVQGRLSVDGNIASMRSITSRRSSISLI